MKSQYLEPYQNHVLARLTKNKKPYSVGTFLTYRLRGNARSWMGRYLRSLKNNLEEDGWVETKSMLGGLAYKPHVSDTARVNGWGSDKWKWVTRLTRCEKMMVKSGKLVILENCPPSGGGNGTGSTVRKVIYRNGRFCHRMPNFKVIN